MEQDLQALEDRLTAVINSRCNPIGCDNCDLKYGGFESKDCSATDLQNRILEVMMITN